MHALAHRLCAPFAAACQLIASRHVTANWLTGRLAMPLPLPLQVTALRRQMLRELKVREFSPEAEFKVSRA
jgi:hypothetical protein